MITVLYHTLFYFPARKESLPVTAQEIAVSAMPGSWE